jgi:hypothetical protein
VKWSLNLCFKPEVLPSVSPYRVLVEYLCINSWVEYCHLDFIQILCMCLHPINKASYMYKGKTKAGSEPKKNQDTQRMVLPGNKLDPFTTCICPVKHSLSNYLIWDNWLTLQDKYAWSLLWAPVSEVIKNRTPVTF